MRIPLRHFFSRFQNWIGILIVLNFLGMAIIASLAPEPPPQIPGTLTELLMKNKLDREPQPPSLDHPLGTLVRQQDIFEWLLRGARQALEFSLKAGLISAAIGILLGAASAYLGGWFNSLVLRLSDGMLAIPLIAVMVLIRQIQAVMYSNLTEADLAVSILPGSGPTISAALARVLAIDVVLWAIIAVNWIPYTRIVNAMVVSLKEAPFIQAAHAVGASPARIIWRHLLPNAISPALVFLARDLGWLVILQASLQFAGFGGGSVWGAQLLQGRDWIIGAGGNPFGYWWVWLPGTALIIAYGIGWNLVGDGLNDALNPKAVA